MLALQTTLLRPCSGLRSTHVLRSSAQAVQPRRSPHRGATPLGRRAFGRALAAADDATADSLAAVQQLDALIDALMEKQSPAELAQCVAENIMSFDQRFWLRLATRSDAAADEEQRQQLAALAKVVMQLVDSVVQRTNEQLSESTALLQDILKAAADEQVGAS